ncbi:MAG: hypothetical protein GY714_00500 [Desulfobacterales bacterium]|nr:hypothetical protein [Desulfobacterales bacterium]MCP4159620.1 hypothetical protein [Deltaproteobacteria bacterium]
MNFKILLLVIVVTLSSCFGPKNYRCNFLPETEAPFWVVKGTPEINGYYVGTGESGKSEYGPTGQISEAKNRAVQDLAASIQVFVRNEVNIYKSSDQNRNLTEKISHHIVNMSLGNIEQEGRWLNRNGCILYVRVKLDKKVANKMLKIQMENIRKFNSSESLFILAGNEQLKTDERVKYLKDANKLLKKIDFRALNISGITNRNYTFYFNRNTKKITTIIDNAKGYIELLKLKKIFPYYNRSLSSSKRKTKIININQAIALLSRVNFTVLNRSKFKQKDKKHYRNLFYKTRDYLKDIIRYYIKIGMSQKQVTKMLGKPIQKTKTYYLPIVERGFRYKKYWIIFKNGIVSCIVKPEGFRLNSARLCKSCKWHKKNQPESIVK